MKEMGYREQGTGRATLPAGFLSFPGLVRTLILPIPYHLFVPLACQYSLFAVPFPCSLIPPSSIPYGRPPTLGTYPCCPLNKLTPRKVTMMAANPKIAT